MSESLRGLLISVVVLGGLALVGMAAALAAPADKIYSVCEIRASDETGSVVANSLADKKIVIRGRLGSSYHFGVILTDDRCINNFVRIIFPVPDPKGVYQNFKFLRTQNQTTAVKYFMCECSGRVSFKYNIAELDVDGSVINEIEVPEKLPSK